MGTTNTKRQLCIRIKIWIHPRYDISQDHFAPRVGMLGHYLSAAPKQRLRTYGKKNFRRSFERARTFEAGSMRNGKEAQGPLDCEATGRYQGR
jgi:hypothetical protein